MNPGVCEGDGGQELTFAATVAANKQGTLKGQQYPLSGAST